MIFIAHRINTIKELKEVPPEYGVEIDLRDSDKKLLVTHDPFTNGERFNKYLKAYRHRFLICNIKSERIELSVRELLKKNRVDNYFFLDSSFPMMYMLSKQGERNVAVRFSEFESIETVLALKGKIKWVWVDCFNKMPLTTENAAVLRKAGFRICLVSPELQGREKDVVSYANFIAQSKIRLDAICAKMKVIPVWRKTLSL